MNVESVQAPRTAALNFLLLFAAAVFLVVSGAGTNVANAAPYQATAHAQCPSGKDCVLKFPKTPNGTRLDVSFASCEITGGPNLPSAAFVNSTRFYLQTGEKKKAIALNLRSPAVGSDSEQYDGTYWHTFISQPVLFSIAQGEALSLYAWPTQNQDGSRYVNTMDCTVHGDLADISSPAPYQATAHAQCPTGVNCVVQFPAVASMIDVQFVSCEVRSTAALTNNSRFYLQTTQDGADIAMPLAMLTQGYQDGNGTFYSSISQQVRFDVPAGQPLKVFGWPGYGNFDRLDCTVAGWPRT